MQGILESHHCSHSWIFDLIFLNVFLYFREMCSPVDLNKTQQTFLRFSHQQSCSPRMRPTFSSSTGESRGSQGPPPEGSPGLPFVS